MRLTNKDKAFVMAYCDNGGDVDAALHTAGYRNLRYGRRKMQSLAIEQAIKQEKAIRQEALANQIAEKNAQEWEAYDQADYNDPDVIKQAIWSVFCKAIRPSAGVYSSDGRRILKQGVNQLLKPDLKTSLSALELLAKCVPGTMATQKQALEISTDADLLEKIAGARHQLQSIDVTPPRPLDQKMIEAVRQEVKKLETKERAIEVTYEEVTAEKDSEK